MIAKTMMMEMIPSTCLFKCPMSNSRGEVRIADCLPLHLLCILLLETIYRLCNSTRHWWDGTFSNAFSRKKWCLFRRWQRPRLIVPRDFAVSWLSFVVGAWCPRHLLLQWSARNAMIGVIWNVLDRYCLLGAKNGPVVTASKNSACIH